MKSIIEQIKTAVMLIILAFSLYMLAQKEKGGTPVFIGAYNIEGEKITKGQFKFINYSLLGILEDKKLVQIYARDIGYIKTRCSVGHNMLAGSAVGLTVGTIYGISTNSNSLNSFADPGFTLGLVGGQGASFGIIRGGIAGSAIGSFTALFKNSITYDLQNVRK